MPISACSLWRVLSLLLELRVKNHPFEMGMLAGSFAMLTLAMAGAFLALLLSSQPQSIHLKWGSSAQPIQAMAAQTWP